MIGLKNTTQRTRNLSYAMTDIPVNIAMLIRKNTNGTMRTKAKLFYEMTRQKLGQHKAAWILTKMTQYRRITKHGTA